MRIELGQAYSFQQQGKRGNQEDSRWPDLDKPKIKQRFFVVCDGVGGSEGGEVASQTVCKAFGKMLSKHDFTEDFTNKEFNHCLDNAYNALDNTVKKKGELWDMGTTLTFAAFHGGGCTLVHIGDSRIYQVRPSVGIIYRSEDHTYVNSYVHFGHITPEEAKSHPKRNNINRCMAPVPTDDGRCKANVQRTTDVKGGDYFLLCTDGVLCKMTDGQIEELLCSSLSDEEKMCEMAQRCKDSSDNNTAYLISVSKVEDDEAADSEPVADAACNTRKLTPNRTFEEMESIQEPVSQKNFFRKIIDNLKSLM